MTEPRALSPHLGVQVTLPYDPSSERTPRRAAIAGEEAFA